MAGVCKLCGTPHADGAKFCTECGAVLISRMGEDKNIGATETKIDAAFTEVKTENESNSEVTEPSDNVVETVDSTEKNDGVANTYGAANAAQPSAYSNPYTYSGSNPYGGSNYNAPNGSNPYGGSNYNAPNGSNPYGGSDYNAPNGSNPNGYNPEAPNGYNPYGVPYPKNPMQPERKLNLGMLIFSIINIVLGCCDCTGFIFGGAGIAFTMMAKNAKTDEDAANYNKISLVLNIIGVVTSILVFAAAIAIGMSEGFETV